MEASSLLTLFFGTQIVFDMHLRYIVCQIFPLIFSSTVLGPTSGHLLVLSVSRLLISITTKLMLWPKVKYCFGVGSITKIAGEMTIVTAQPNLQQFDEATVRGKVDGSTKWSHYMVPFLKYVQPLLSHSTSLHRKSKRMQTPGLR